VISQSINRVNRSIDRFRNLSQRVWEAVGYEMASYPSIRHHKSQLLFNDYAHASVCRLTAPRITHTTTNRQRAKGRRRTERRWEPGGCVEVSSCPSSFRLLLL